KHAGTPGLGPFLPSPNGLGLLAPLGKYQIQSSDLYTSAIKHCRIFGKYPALCSLVGMKLSADANHLGISSETAWRRWQRGELPAQQVPSGTVMVEVPPLAQGARPQQVAVYARVSSAEPRKHLDRQAERVVACCLARGWPVAGPWRREA